ncbi:MAG TPA: hypothetical protein ENI17_15945 [Pseudomonas xinjiangensis]|uniref:Uncharacterized protein n=2 Tax=root TaxID=1 RepID=A0A7V1BMT5_9GAMM|nr:hypothetical protein [Halopseudomonas xinjiangensis]HEC49094.1 hypothetical protein [Halopseudomonas xinjiangensis]
MLNVKTLTAAVAFATLALAGPASFAGDDSGSHDGKNATENNGTGNPASVAPRGTTGTMRGAEDGSTGDEMGGDAATMGGRPETGTTGTGAMGTGSSPYNQGDEEVNTN